MRGIGGAAVNGQDRDAEDPMKYTLLFVDGVDFPIIQNRAFSEKDTSVAFDLRRCQLISRGLVIQDPVSDKARIDHGERDRKNGNCRRNIFCLGFLPEEKIFKEDKKANNTAAIVVTALDALATFGFARVVYLYTILKYNPIPEETIEIPTEAVAETVSE